MKKVLVFTYYWPPGSSPGVQRWLKFTKYLHKFGWTPEIVTVNNGNFPSYDHSLEKEIHPDIQVHKTKTLEPFRVFNLLTGNKGASSPVGMSGIKGSTSPIKKLGLFIRANFFIPDARMGWNFFALNKGRKLLNSRNYDAVISTGPPHSTHLVCKKLKSEFDIKWLADFRDPWSTVYYNKYLPRTERSTQKDLRLERSVLKNADAVITISEGLQKELSNLGADVSVVYNGFDEEDFNFVKNIPKKRFELCYIGNFKDNQNTTALWSALTEIIKENESFSKQFKLNLTGNISPNVDHQLKQIFGDHYEQNSFVDHDKAVELMVDTTMLLFIIPECEGNEYILTGKLFEYLASGTEMLSIGPVKGNAARIIKECGQFEMVDYTDKKQIKDTILRFFKNGQRELSTSKQSISPEVMKYSRKMQTKELSVVLNKMISK